jgi:hypothetical protein
LGSNEKPGGLVLLRPLPSIIVPDLHGRVGYLKALMAWTPPGTERTVHEGLAAGEIQVICVGDGFHAEARAIRRWERAYREYSGGFKKHAAMDAEMRENLGVMMTVMELKALFPRHFHFLKGNHENIANEYSPDNRPFGKFAEEGAMVTAWCGKFMSINVYRKYYEFEKRLPVFAVGDRFCVTHAEPRRYHPAKNLINALVNREVVFDLTWTDNGAAEKGSVRSYLDEYFPADPKALMFGGHRPVRDRYTTRADGRYIQIHNPAKFIAVFIRDISDFSPEENIRVLPHKGV